VLTERVFIIRATVFEIHKFYVLLLQCVEVFTAITFVWDVNGMISVNKTESI